MHEHEAEALPELTFGTDAGRAMIRLLWDPPPPSTRGRSRGLSVASIVAAGISLAERDGIEALSMRRLASELGVGTMSLYTHIPGRDELFELMIDRVYGERALPDPTLPWRAQLTAHADAAWQMYQDHPWLVNSHLWRIPLGPGVMRVQEDIHRAATLIGLSPVDTARLAGIVEAHVFAAARQAIIDMSLAAQSGMDADEYWNSRADFWTTYYRTEDHPATTRLWEQGAFDAVGDEFHQYRLGLDLILEGVERRVARDRAGQQGPGEDTAGGD